MNKPQVVPKSASELNKAIRTGKVTGILKQGGGGNSNSVGGMDARKLEEAEVGRIATVDRSLSKAIMQARTAKKMTQKELGGAIQEKPQIVGEYENGKAVPNAQIIGKLERALNCKLPRPAKKKAIVEPGSDEAKKIAAKKPNALTNGGPAKRR